MAEVYAVLTGMPGNDRASPDEAMLFLSDVRERLTVVSLDENDYVSVIERSAADGVAGGGIYDALLARCALKATADRSTRGMSNILRVSARWRRE